MFPHVIVVLLDNVQNGIMGTMCDYKTQNSEQLIRDWKREWEQ